MAERLAFQGNAPPRILPFLHVKAKSLFRLTGTRSRFHLHPTPALDVIIKVVDLPLGYTIMAPGLATVRLLKTTVKLVAAWALHLPYAAAIDPPDCSQTVSIRWASSSDR